MPVAPNVGVAARLGTNGDTTSAPAAPTSQYEFLSEALASEREVIRTEGLRGTRLHPVARVRQGRLTPGGTIVLEPTYAELATLLPYWIGAVSAQAGYGTYTVSDTVPVAFQVVVDRVAKVFTYTGCRTSKVTFKGSAGQPLQVSWDVEALNESVGAAGSVNWSGVTVSETPPFVWHDGVLTVNAATYQIMDFECTVDWKLKTDRWVNSQTRTDLPSLDLSVMYKLTLPYTSDTAPNLYDVFTSSGGVVTGVTGNINFAFNGAGGGAAGVNLKLDWAGMVFPAKKSPVVSNRDEITLALEGEARKTAAGTAPLIVSLDSTP